MANIQHWLEQIRRAIYGREVRSSIADAIEAINKEQSYLDGAFDQLIINAGNSNAEVVAARVKADGTQFNTLGQRLDKNDEDFDLLNKEVIEARTDKAGIDHGRLKTRLDVVDEELEKKDKLYNVGIDVENNGENTNGNAIGKFYVGQNGDVRTVELFNRSGVKDGGTHTNADGKESFVIHHYNDKGATQIDNVGRNNFILKLKNARNSVQAKHDKTGSGDYLVCERDCSDLKATVTITHDSSINRTVNIFTDDIVFDKFSNSIYKSLTTRQNVDLWSESFNNPALWSYVDGFGNETLLSVQGVNLKDEGLSLKDEYVPSIMGRLGGKFKDFLFKSIYFFTKGNNDHYGEPAIQLYSTNKGGSCLKTKNIGNSKGASIHIENYSNTADSYGIRVDNRTNGNACYSAFNYANAPYSFYRSMTDVTPDVLIVKDKDDNIIFKINGDGKTLFMTDSGDGSLRALRVTNGNLVIT